MVLFVLPVYNLANGIVFYLYTYFKTGEWKAEAYEATSNEWFGLKGIFDDRTAS